MQQNPLQQFFRQPKIFVGLPSRGIFNKPGSLVGDVTHMPVYGMTGMDEIIMKTPDALMSGDATVKVIQSCCPNIKDAWELSAMDSEMILAAIRIATYGNDITVKHTCPHCQSENEYELDLSRVIEHYNVFKYDNVLRVNGLTVRLQPMTYRLSTEFALKNYAVQKRLEQAKTLEDAAEQQRIVAALFDELSAMQAEIYNASIEAVETPSETVTDREYINEWVRNCDKSVFDAIKSKFEENRKAIKMPPFKTKCESCDAENDVNFELDETNFFVSA